MKKLSYVLVIALLLCLAACGTAEVSPTEAPATVPTSRTEATTAAELSPEEMIEQLRDEIFEPAFEIWSYWHHGAEAYEDVENSLEPDSFYYLVRVTDPRFQTVASLEAATLALFSEALAQSYFSLTAEYFLDSLADDDPRREAARQLPLYFEQDGKLYNRRADWGGNLSIESIKIESRSENKVVYRLHAVSPWEGEPVLSEEYLYTRELIDGKWVFTEFPMDWY